MIAVSEVGEGKIGGSKVIMTIIAIKETKCEKKTKNLTRNKIVL